MSDQQIVEVLGKVISIDEKRRQGRVRLADNRRVHFNFSIASKDDRPRKSDNVRVRLKLVDGRPRVVGVERESTDVGLPLNSLSPDDVPEILPDIGRGLEPGDIVEGGNGRISSTARKLYEQAAVAKTEGRYAAAKVLFEQAIAAGASKDAHIAYFKMVSEGKGRDFKLARAIINKALVKYPSDATLYVMYGQMERRLNDLPEAERILRTGLSFNPNHSLLKWGLAQVLAEIATAQSLKEATIIFDSLEKEGKLNKSDISYVRFRALASNPRAGRAYSFLDKIYGFRPGIAGRKDLPSDVSDLVVEITDNELEASFGLSGAYLVRCFAGVPKRTNIEDLSRYLRSMKQDSTLGLINGRDVAINTTLAFVVVPSAQAVRDFLMSVLSEKNEALLPIDEGLMKSGGEAKVRIKEVLSHYLGSRDLYDSTLPVSGRRLFGRERLVVQLADQANRGEFVGVFGLRKMGKTSLIYQLRDEKLKDEAVSYVDLQASLGFSTGSFLPVLWEIERDLLTRLAPRFPKVKLILRLGRFSRYSDALQAGLDPALSFSEDIRELLDHIVTGQLPGVKRVVVILDELERCLPLAGQRAMEGYIEFFGLLRGLAQTDRYRGVITSVVVAANPAISETAYWEGRENPVFSLYKPLFLPPLSISDTTQMIKELGKGMSVYWSLDAAETIFEELGGHPFLTRVLCSQISQNYLQRPLNVNREMVIRELPIFIRDKSDKFEQITELLHSHFPVEEKFLEDLALDKVEKNVPDDVVRHLLGYHLIERADSKYTIKFNSLKLWLRRRAGVVE